ncbi:hypothetical protein AKJ40_01345 [candidate division MSBL1 archaeon SCGC-AAA259M10]|uniref:Uncharacterized protein n=1 Tax=candidate division MSBL1 archaeon SCGC-AAA259M10 TaxID=1698270 RepID=A0A133V1U4_9EURY|nr:hypothetical protein AKJ40_01345 [candidate division MSBL1 archaeon SCGC-AAA259M10]
MPSDRRYTANIHNTGSLIPESKKILKLYDKLRDVEEVREVLYKENPLSRESEGAIDKILFITRKRYLNDDPGPLIEVIKSDLNEQITNAILFYHLAKTDNLVYDLTTELLYNLHEEGTLVVNKKDVEDFLKKKEEKHPEISEWAITTRNKLIRHFLAAVKDFGLLEGSKRKKFSSYHLPSESFFYIFYRKFYDDETISEILSSKDWNLFFLDEEEIKAILNEGNRKRYIRFEESGNIRSVNPRFDSLEEYVNEIT